jgi:hypothetical protein
MPGSNEQQHETEAPQKTEVIDTQADQRANVKASTANETGLKDTPLSQKTTEQVSDSTQKAEKLSAGRPEAADKNSDVTDKLPSDTKAKVFAAVMDNISKIPKEDKGEYEDVKLENATFVASRDADLNPQITVLLKGAKSGAIINQPSIKLGRFDTDMNIAFQAPVTDPPWNEDDRKDLNKLFKTV